MVATTLMIAASSILGLSQAAPFSRAAHSSLRRDFTYKSYGGDGTVAQGWPAVSDWASFDTLWKEATEVMAISCIEGIPKNSKDEIAAVKEGILEASKGSGLDKRYLLAVIMQESNGCVRVNTTYSIEDDIRNPGLMQDFKGKHTCNDPKAGTELLNPCPKEQIIGMITDGAGVTNPGGLKQAVQNSKAQNDSKYYRAARIYNSGAVDASGNLGKGGATHCYASDLANRLLGWKGDPKVCKETEIGNLKGTTRASNVLPSSTGTVASGVAIPSLSASGAPFPIANGTLSAGPTGTSYPTAPFPVSTGLVVATPTPSAIASSTGGEVTSQAVGPKADGAAADCKAWYTVKAGDDCTAIESFYGLPSGSIKKLNTGLDAQCTNLLSGSSYCVRNV